MFLKVAAGILLAASCLASPLFAQAEKSEAQGSFRLLGWEGTTTDLYYLLGDKKTPVSISPFAKSEFYHIPKDGALAFYRDTVDAAGKPQAEPVGGVTLDPDWKYPLVLAVPDHAQQGKFTFSASNDDPANFPAGSIRLVNATKERIIARLSGRSVVVAPQESQTVNLKPTTLKVVDIELSAEAAGNRKPVYERGWELEPTMRITAFIVLDAEGRYRTRRMRENESTFLPKTPAPERKRQTVGE